MHLVNKLGCNDIVESLVQLVGTAMLCLCSSALADVSGTVRAIRDVQVADTSIVPYATSLGDYIRIDPALTSTKWLSEVTIKTADGKEVKIVQDRDPSIEVGATVTVTKMDGNDRVVRR